MRFLSVFLGPILLVSAAVAGEREDKVLSLAQRAPFCKTLAENFEKSLMVEMRAQGDKNPQLRALFKNIQPVYVGLSGDLPTNEDEVLKDPSLKISNEDTNSPAYLADLNYETSERERLAKKLLELEAKNENLSADNRRLMEKLKEIVTQSRPRSAFSPKKGSKNAGADGCFEANTPILRRTPGETGKVEMTTVSQVKPGDYLPSYFVWENDGKTFQSGEICWDKVTRVFERQVPEQGTLRKLEIALRPKKAPSDSMGLLVTENHRFLRSASEDPIYEWEPAGKLLKDHYLFPIVRSPKSQLRVEDSVAVNIHNPTRVYNFTTQITHTYYIGDLLLSVLVHNLKL